ncbi:hypothetical protein M513_11061 [Trichuris suis]|uniref:Uncharacterized protein n=1 Tax=Trichuris suis TaxID=68888 RepID=A0A085LSU5_9BILA|nr:hypothetical protein M513_11061 [Trichuris suis]
MYENVDHNWQRYMTVCIGIQVSIEGVTIDIHQGGFCIRKSELLTGLSFSTNLEPLNDDVRQAKHYFFVGEVVLRPLMVMPKKSFERSTL